MQELRSKGWVIGKGWWQVDQLDEGRRVGGKGTWTVRTGLFALTQKEAFDS